MAAQRTVREPQALGLPPREGAARHAVATHGDLLWLGSLPKFAKRLAWRVQAMRYSARGTRRLLKGAGKLVSLSGGRVVRLVYLFYNCVLPQ